MLSEARLTNGKVPDFSPAPSCFQRTPSPARFKARLWTSLSEKVWKHQLCQRDKHPTLKRGTEGDLAALLIFSSDSPILESALRSGPTTPAPTCLARQGGPICGPQGQPRSVYVHSQVFQRRQTHHGSFHLPHRHGLPHVQLENVGPAVFKVSAHVV